MDQIDPEALIRAVRLQAGGCAAFGSPFSAALLERLAEDIAADGPSLAPFAPWTGASTRSLIADAVPLRLLGALHDLALSGDDPALAAAWPSPGRASDLDVAWRAAAEAIAGRGERLAAFMTHEPQTNEVRRSACLLGGFLEIARSAGLPLRCFELGASAGLNQSWDRFHYRLAGAGEWGDPDAGVVIDAEWRGPPPLFAAPVSVTLRAACDRAPVDLADPLARRRLRAFVWPDQFDRLERLDAAIATALAAGVRVDAEDAASWAARRAAPVAVAATVVYHSVFWQYMPPASQDALAGAIADHGARASADAPFAWLRMEPRPDNLAIMELTLTQWPGGGERRLATVHPHGAWIEWAS